MKTIGKILFGIVSFCLVGMAGSTFISCTPESEIEIKTADKVLVEVGESRLVTCEINPTKSLVRMKIVGEAVFSFTQQENVIRIDGLQVGKGNLRVVVTYKDKNASETIEVEVVEKGTKPDEGEGEIPTSPEEPKVPDGGGTTEPGDNENVNNKPDEGNSEDDKSDVSDENRVDAGERIEFEYADTGEGYLQGDVLHVKSETNWLNVIINCAVTSKQVYFKHSTISEKINLELGIRIPKIEEESAEIFIEFEDEQGIKYVKCLQVVFEC